MTKEIEIVPTNEQKEEQGGDNIIELRNELQSLLEERFPVKQEFDDINHRIEILKLRIQNANTKYFQNKGM